MSESIQIYNSVSKDTSAIETKVREVIGRFADNPYLKKIPFDQSFIIEKFSDGAKSVANYLFVHLTNLTQNTIIFLVQFGVMFYALFSSFATRSGSSQASCRCRPWMKPKRKSSTKNSP